MHREKQNMTKSNLPLLILMGGFLVIFLGVVLGPGVPFQDATPEMRAIEAKQEKRSLWLAGSGLCLFAGGIFWCSSRWIRRRLGQNPGSSN